MRNETRRAALLGLITALLSAGLLWPGTTGKIAGTVIDKQTGEPLGGANVMVEDTEYGAAADLDGQFTILHVPPGVYNVQFTVIGYAKVTVTDVRINIDQTARVDVGLEMEALEGETVTVVAERTAIKEDVATSVVSVSNDEVEVLPVSSIDGVAGMQAGIQGGLTIRGDGAENVLFLLDGVTLRDPRNNQPVSNIALSAIKEINIERGGFNAEYGQVQAGLVNVVTQEGSKKAYHGSITTKLSPPAAKYFRSKGIPDVHDPDSYWMRPYLDDDVCWTGTSSGVWDKYQIDEYPSFIGWNEISRILCTDNNPDNDLTPLAAQRVFMYEVRKPQINDQPDYEMDCGFGGPVPLIGRELGDLRFYTSYRRDREMLLFPMTRPDYVDYDWTAQITSDLSNSMRFRISGLLGKRYTMESNWAAGYYPRWPHEIADVAAYSHQAMFADWDFCLTDIAHRSLAGKLTHTLSPKTFYEVSLEYFYRDYYTRPTAWRDTSTLYEIVPGYFRDENPFGYWPETEEGLIVGSTSHASKARDNTEVSSVTLKADLTSQMNFNNLVKTGMELVYNDLDFDYGVIASASEGKRYDNRVQMRVFPIRAALYFQDKLETKGFTLNAGLRLDYSNSNSEWWNVDPYNSEFFSSSYNEDAYFNMKDSEPQWQLSPRLGISHPITENSKLFFNYGHFKQMPQYETLFRLRRTSDKELTAIGDPNLMLAKTISYELGYDQILLNDFMIQLAAFYKDISDQQNTTNYTSIRGFSYNLTTSQSYEDIRGFELTLRKTTGRWWSGFANYTYQVSTEGSFGREEVYQDPSLQKKYDEATVNLYQQRPIPRPYARANLTVFSPGNLGPEFLGHHYLGGFSANLLVDWQAGEWVTYNPKNVSGIINNVESLDWFNATLRISKTIHLSKFQVQFLVDMNNLFNTKRLWQTGDQDYRRSLHLPSHEKIKYIYDPVTNKTIEVVKKTEAYDNIPGDDKIGDYRKPGVEFQPIEGRGSIDLKNDSGEKGVIYYVWESDRYLEYLDDTWVVVNPKRMNKILKDKAYIDMPNASTFWFLNPRRIYFGIRLSFNFN
ncbi:TonB-dependent receptor [bacterium]|nr:TonB-dependent receptor [bacterium]RQV97484.1 MAG: TonB-dependent receptor [bacterium]